MQINFECVHCGEINLVDLSDINLGDLAGDGVSGEADPDEILELKEQIKELEILSDRQEQELINAQSGISKAISKSERPSMEIQGEVAEEVLNDLLQDSFPEDIFTPIKKGQSGADIRQSVMMPSGREAGSILYESKNTKNWSNKWIEKLRTDMQSDGATVGLIVSKAFPAKHSDALVQLEEKIWLCKPGIHVTAFVKALRQGILMGARRDILDEFTSKNLKDSLYEYVTSDFIEQISNIARVYLDLKGELTKEQTAFQRKWKAREKLLDQLESSMTGMVGSIEGLGVPSMKLDKIKELTLD